MSPGNHNPEDNEEIAIAVPNDAALLTPDNGGRRSAIDRRIVLQGVYHPERRSARNRRSIPDRRSSPHFKLYKDIERRQAFK